MTRLQLSIILIILMIGASLRFQALDTLSQGISYDEAFYAIDSLSLLNNPRLTPFFPENFGRESAWMYALTPFLAFLPQEAFTLRIASAFTGLLTLAATYQLTYQLFKNRWGAIWAMAGLAVFYWHVHFSHLPLRAILFPLIGTLAFAYLWRAKNTNQIKHWALAGLLLAVLSYTYFSARVWLGLAGVTMIYLFIISPPHRRGLVLTSLIAIIGSSPLVLYIMSHPELASHRIDDVVIANLSDLLKNIPAWLEMWAIRGSDNISFNLIGRPIFDLPLGGLFLIGCGMLFTFTRHKIQALWVIVLALGSSTITLITTDPTNMIRMLGTVIPIAVIIGAGAVGIQSLTVKMFRSPVHARWLTLAPLLFVLWAGYNTRADFEKWVASDRYLPFEEHLYQATNFIITQTDQSLPVYFTPFSPFHPVINFHKGRMDVPYISGFDSLDCWVLPEDQALLYALTMFEAGYLERLGDLAEVKPLYQGDHYDINQIITHREFLTSGQTFTLEDGITLSIIRDMPDRVSAGDTVNMMAVFRVDQPISDDLTLFLHLHGTPSPYEGGTLWAQSDQPVCVSAPARFWRTDEFIIQPLQLHIPPETPPADYEIALGVYQARSQERLMIGDQDYVILQPITVSD